MRYIIITLFAIAALAVPPSSTILPSIAVHDTLGNITTADSVYAILYADTIISDADSSPVLVDSAYFARLQLPDTCGFFTITWGVEKYSKLQILSDYIWNTPDSMPVPTSQQILMLTSDGDTSGFVAWGDSIWAMFDSLAEVHGEGDWRSSLALPFILTLTEEEFLAKYGGADSRPIRVYRGDSKTVDITVTEADGDTVDVTGASAIFTAREGESDTTAIIVDTLSIEDGPYGEIRLALTSDQTTIEPRSYAADIQLTMPDSTVQTIWRSRFIVEWDVTR